LESDIFENFSMYILKISTFFNTKIFFVPLKVYLMAISIFICQVGKPFAVEIRICKIHNLRVKRIQKKPIYVA
jgi:hypothetical protein